MTKKQDSLQDIRNEMQALYDKASCHDGGWAISNSALKDFIKRLDVLIAPPKGATFIVDGSKVTVNNAGELVDYMHSTSLTQAADDKAYMLDVADRTRLQSGIELRTDSAEAFVNDLVKFKMVQVAL